jgi:uncharacterized protein (UPF0333 family)
MVSSPRDILFIYERLMSKPYPASIIEIMKETRFWIIAIVLLIVAGLAAYFVVDAVRDMTEAVSDSTEKAMQPINDVAAMSGEVATQVSQFINPTPTILPDPVTIIHDVRTLARLETIQYSVEKVITADKGQGALDFLFGDQLIFVAHGIVIAGVDLSGFAANDLWLEDNVLYARLPPAEVFVATLDNEKSYVYDRDTGIFTKGSIDLETNARQVAEDEIAKAALEDGILNLANTNAEYFLLRLFQNLGYEDVIFAYEAGE